MPSFEEYLVSSVGPERARVVTDALSGDPSVSVRLNPSKKVDGLFEDGKGIPWNNHARILPSRPSFTLDPLFHGGAYYVQDTSAMFPVHLMREFLPKDEDTPRVLDLCAAPGGKSTDIASSLRELYGEGFLLVSNEVVRQRAASLCDNIARWGDPCCVVTSCDPKAFSSLEGFFDVIVADVPCSGEGMFRKDSEAVAQWSEDNVSLCAQRARRIASDAWGSLRRGGLLIFSTCTFNRLENDDNLLWIAENLGGEILSLGSIPDGVFRTDAGYSLLPGYVPGEGQWAGAIRKTSGVSRQILPKARQSSVKAPSQIRNMVKGNVDYYLEGDLYLAVPSHLQREISSLDRLHPLMKGVALGRVKGKDFVPHADLALSTILCEGAFQKADLPLGTTLAYLHMDPIVLKDSEKGYVLVSYRGLPLGFVKNIGNRTNTLLPKGRRIMMDIPEPLSGAL